MPHNDPVWHREAVTPTVERAVDYLSESALPDAFYLAGGTALALQFGHRRSLDLDFFSPTPFDTERLISNIHHLPSFSVTARDENTLHAQIEGVKVSFIGYAYPLLFPLSVFHDAKVADSRDIACMKLSAIAGRGARRDFIDLFVVAQKYGLDRLFVWFGEKFAKANYNTVHLLKSLTFFEEAEREPMPHMLAEVQWEEVKTFFLKNAPRRLR